MVLGGNKGMIESFVLIEDYYENVYKKYISITGIKNAEVGINKIICDDIMFEGKEEWCRMTLLLGESFAEEVLLQLSNGNKLAYFYSDDSQMDCEFLVIKDNQIIRKKYIYADTPELNEDEGVLLCEEEGTFEYWNDIDYFIEIARENPNKLFEH